MIEPYSSEKPVTSSPEPGSRPRKSGGVNVLLGVLTFFNVVSFFLVGAGLGDAIDHGDEELEGLLTASLLINLVALVALGGAWATRKWGPRLYLGAVVLDRLVVLVVLPEAFPPVAILGVVLAVVLLSIAEKNW